VKNKNEKIVYGTLSAVCIAGAVGFPYADKILGIYFAVILSVIALVILVWIFR
jgi:hypothetical protein